MASIIVEQLGPLLQHSPRSPRLTWETCVHGVGARESEGVCGRENQRLSSRFFSKFVLGSPASESLGNIYHR